VRENSAEVERNKSRVGNAKRFAVKYETLRASESTAARSQEEHMVQKLLNIHSLGHDRRLFNNTVFYAQVISIVVKLRDVVER
jgi:hypothetical protein